MCASAAASILLEMADTEYSVAEEIVHAVTHGIGALLSLAGLVVLVIDAAAGNDPWRIVSAAVYGSSLVILYLGSTLYHALRMPGLKEVFRVLDHSSIFVLIAGTYTPFTLVTLRGPWGWTFFGLAWGLCLAGISLKTILGKRFGFLFGLLYLAMGWMSLLALKPLVSNLAPAGFGLLLGGGLVYSLGVIFYSIDRIPWNHAIWHVLVMAGSILHYTAILFYVIPAAG